MTAWPADQETKLMEMFNAGAGEPHICSALGMTRYAVMAIIDRLGLRYEKLHVGCTAADRLFEIALKGRRYEDMELK